MKLITQSVANMCSTNDENIVYLNEKKWCQECKSTYMKDDKDGMVCPHCGYRINTAI